MCSRSILRYDPHRVDDAWDIAEDRQKDIDPKLRADSDLQKHPQRREKNRGHDAPKIHRNSFHKTQIGYVADELQAYIRGPEPDSPGPIGLCDRGVGESAEYYA